MANGDYYWGQQYGEFLLPHEELVHMAAHVQAVKPFRKRFVYAGWNYGLVTELVETVTGTTLGNCITERFLKPLGMHRTTLADTDGWDNLALGYGLDSDGSPHNIRFQQMNDGIGLAGAYGGKSSLKDVLLMYRGLLSAQQDQAGSGNHESPQSPFTYTKDIFEPHTVLPGVLAIASLNTVAWLGPKASPVMGSKRKGLEIWHHVGSMPVCLAAAFLIPGTQSAVVVLTNSIGFMDPSDFVAQQLLAIVVGEKVNNQLIDLAKAAKVANLNQYPKLYARLLKDRTGKTTNPAEAYEGYYWNAIGNFCITIVLQSSRSLRMKIQDVPRTGYNLEPYDGDIWWWPPNRKDELCEKGMAAFMHPRYHLISFSSSTGGQIDQLTWHHDPTAEPETFYRRSDRPRWKGYPYRRAHL